MTVKPSVAKIEDREFEGVCGECGRHGLRWVAILSDGSAVGLECTKKLLGYRPKPTAYQWIGDFEAVASHTEHAQTWVMWQRKGGTSTRETMNGHLMIVGGVRGEWARRGWL